ncbi:iron uptake transporter deferrochelatase/peroxidase subunit [Lysinibacillus antri]|uniref:Deferrochelatase n=1 Tax=Lysinibacillus antri TaxID=2498145 RepID=A0A3S0RVS6_9BACI|nr:iron uptake transporter deferrochelatase/peroxidase subunit [Lysinibacillus antri]RUL53082.1 deferrochelatase/peroxidase EfeB [Lysinibacillus antri]
MSKKITRREMLKLTGMTAAGVAIGASGFGGVAKALGYNLMPVDDNLLAANKVMFYGKHQSGIATPVQKHVYFASLEVLASTKEELQDLFKLWTPLSVRLMNGEDIGDSTTNAYVPPTDTGETNGLDASNLSLTFGVGPSLFEKKELGLAHLKPSELKELPHFPKDQLDEAFCGGDLCIQACADDPQVAFHAVRNLIRQASGKVLLKWTQTGFNALPANGGTPRNLFSFKDGTVNPSTPTDFDRTVWVDSGKSWMTNGTYLIVRRIQMHLETWDRTSLKDQEAAFGRHRDSGAPIGKTNEFDEVDLTAVDKNNKLLIPEDSHVFLAKKANKTILRRAFSYSSGIVSATGAYDAGLLFISFQKDPKSFIDIQNSLGRLDRLNEYITHRGSAIFACFPGVAKGSYIGEALFTTL